MPKLGVNIDHVATIREARRISYPDPIAAALACEEAGCDSIVAHLREDRRHIKDADILSLRRKISTRLNLEMSVARDIVAIACKAKPDQATIVPEKRREVTTEGGLDVKVNFRRVRDVVSRLADRGIDVSLFINPSKGQIDASRAAGAKIIELHTGEYANARTLAMRKAELNTLKRVTEYAISLGLEVNAGHGLNYENTRDVAVIEGMNELNIGHSIISRAVFVGIGNAVKEMLEMMR